MSRGEELDAAISAADRALGPVVLGLAQRKLRRRQCADALGAVEALAETLRSIVGARASDTTQPDRPED